jgi:hypothetical protein
MTPKEKAKDLFDLYNDLMGCAYWNEVPVYLKLNKIMAINCALIAVDEIINEFYTHPVAKIYWQEVKKQIEKL